MAEPRPGRGFHAGSRRPRRGATPCRNWPRCWSTSATRNRRPLTRFRALRYHRRTTSTKPGASSRWRRPNCTVSTTASTARRSTRAVGPAAALPGKPGQDRRRRRRQERPHRRKDRRHAHQHRFDRRGAQQLNALHGDLGVVADGDAVLALSASGETDELVDLLPALLRFDISLIALTGRADSTLAQASHAWLDVSVTQEACPLNLAPTSSTTVMLALGDALAMVLLEARGFDKDDFARFHPGGQLGRSLLLKVRQIMRPREEMAARLAGTRPSARCSERSPATGRRGGGRGRRRAGWRAFSPTAISPGISSAARPAWATRPVGDYMTRNPVSIGGERLAVEILHLLEHSRIDDLVVVDADAPAHRPRGHAGLDAAEIAVKFPFPPAIPSSSFIFSSHGSSKRSPQRPGHPLQRRHLRGAGSHPPHARATCARSCRRSSARSRPARAATCGFRPRKRSSWSRSTARRWSFPTRTRTVSFHRPEDLRRHDAQRGT